MSARPWAGHLAAHADEQVDDRRDEPVPNEDPGSVNRFARAAIEQARAQKKDRKNDESQNRHSERVHVLPPVTPII